MLNIFSESKISPFANHWEVISESNGVAEILMAVHLSHSAFGELACSFPYESDEKFIKKIEYILSWFSDKVLDVMEYYHREHQHYDKYITLPVDSLQFRFLDCMSNCSDREQVARFRKFLENYKKEQSCSVS